MKTTNKARWKKFRSLWSSSTFTAKEYEMIVECPRGTASSDCHFRVQAGFLVLTNPKHRPRRYAFAPEAVAQIASSPAPDRNITALLDIVVKFDQQGVKRSNVAELLHWLGDAMLVARPSRGPGASALAQA